MNHIKSAIYKGIRGNVHYEIDKEPLKEVHPRIKLDVSKEVERGVYDELEVGIYNNVELGVRGDTCNTKNKS